MLRVKHFDRPLLRKMRGDQEKRAIISIEDIAQGSCIEISTTPACIEAETRRDWPKDYPEMRYYMSQSWSSNSIEDASDVEALLRKGIAKNIISSFAADMCVDGGGPMADIDFLAAYRDIVLSPSDFKWKPYKVKISLIRDEPVITLHFAKTYSNCEVEDDWVIVQGVKYICLATPQENHSEMDYWRIDVIDSNNIIVNQFDDGMWRTLVQLYSKTNSRNGQVEWQLLYDHYVDDDTVEIRHLLASMFNSVERTGWLEY